MLGLHLQLMAIKVYMKALMCAVGVGACWRPQETCSSEVMLCALSQINEKEVLLHALGKSYGKKEIHFLADFARLAAVRRGVILARCEQC